MKKLVLASAIYFIVFNSIAQEKYMFVFLNDRPDKEPLTTQQIDSLQKDHMLNIQRLVDAEKLLVAGPFEGGGGIFILNTASVTEARNWLQSDPAISAGRYNVEILPWSPRTRAICRVSDSVEMVPYTFIRYNSHITKFNVRDAPQLFRTHDVYVKNVIKTGNVISEGVFDNSDGSTMIMKGDVEREVIMADPAVKNGILQPEIKTLWVGKGSFCEN